MMNLVRAEEADCLGAKAMGRIRNSMDAPMNEGEKLFRSAAKHGLDMSGDPLDIMYVCRYVIGGRRRPTVGHMAELKRPGFYHEERTVMYREYKYEPVAMLFDC